MATGTYKESRKYGITGIIYYTSHEYWAPKQPKIVSEIDIS